MKKEERLMINHQPFAWGRAITTACAATMCLALAIVPASHAHHARRTVVRPLEAGPIAFERHLGLACAAHDGPTRAMLEPLAAGMRARLPQALAA